MSDQQPTHEVDDYGNDIHVDVDPYIPTGLCAVCTWEPEWVDPEAPVEETPAPETTEP